MLHQAMDWLLLVLLITSDHHEAWLLNSGLHHAWYWL